MKLHPSASKLEELPSPCTKEVTLPFVMTPQTIGPAAIFPDALRGNAGVEVLQVPIVGELLKFTTVQLTGPEQLAVIEGGTATVKLPLKSQYVRKFPLTVPPKVTVSVLDSE
jgi:hypothetical protein